MQHPIEWICKTHWNIRQEILWVKNESQYNTNPYRFSCKDIRIYWLYKPLENDVKIFSLDTKVNQWGNVWFLPNDLGAKHKFGKFDHPASFPLFLVLAILFATRPIKNSIIFDPYMGSGTVAKAAQFIGLHYLGCDIDKHYVKMAQNRIQEECGYDEYCYTSYKRILKNGDLDLSKPIKFKNYE